MMMLMTTVTTATSTAIGGFNIWLKGASKDEMGIMHETNKICIQHFEYLRKKGRSGEEARKWEDKNPDHEETDCVMCKLD
jgi:hypothetical protein